MRKLIKRLVIWFNKELKDERKAAIRYDVARQIEEEMNETPFF